MSDDRRDAERALDLLYGEVEGADARALRASLEADAEGAATLARLERAKRLADALPMAELPRATRTSLLEAARAAAAARATARGDEAAAARAARGDEASQTPGRDPAPAEGASDGPARATPSAGTSGGRERAELATGGPSWLERLLAGLKGALLAPQLAMAAVVLVVVVVGVWTIPGETPPAPTRLVADPASAAPRASTPEASIAADRSPEEEEADSWAARERVGSAEVAEAAAPATQTARAAERPTERVTRSRRAAGSSNATLGRRDDRPTDGFLAAEGARREAAPRLEDVPRPQAEPAPAPDAPVYLGRGARAPVAQAAARIDEPPPPPGRYNDLDEESAQLAPNAQGLTARALHASAQSHRAGGDCAQAVRTYEQLFAQHPGYGDLPRALLDAADCQRRLGRITAARRLLVRAEGYPSTEAEARRELQRLETVQQATRRRAAPASPAAVDALAH